MLKLDLSIVIKKTTMRNNNNCQNTFKVNYIIYEKNDTAVLLEGIAKINLSLIHI